MLDGALLLPPEVSVFWGPGSRGLGELKSPWQTPHPHLVPSKYPLSSAQGRECGQSASFGIQVVIKIIIIIKKSEET